jgi:XrtJ-associated TM-motif-TM protein
VRPKAKLRSEIPLEVRFAQEATMKKMLLVFCWSAMLILIALPLRAQNGCVDSPEDPTVVLASGERRRRAGSEIMEMARQALVVAGFLRVPVPFALPLTVLTGSSGRGFSR